MSLTIRLANSTDWPDLIALDTVAANDLQRTSQIENWINSGQCHVLEVDGQLRAYAVLTQHFFDRPFIEMLMVGAAFRRLGYGGALLDHLSALADSAEIWTSTNQSNIIMQRLLASRGFTQRGLIDLDPGDPELILAARLRESLTADPEAYDARFRAKVQEALDDPRPSLSHEEVEGGYPTRTR